MILDYVIIIVLLQFVQISCNFINFFHVIWQFPVKWTNINIGTSALNKNRKPKSALKTDIGASSINMQKNCGEHS